ncbi:MAG: hypothetical protein JWN34_4488 [Bryobacterales bacterium]|nr:hypothetical protein [Bryobacterales bacterium]
MPSKPDLDTASLLPPFEGSLTAALRAVGERGLCDLHALTRETYSTQRFLFRLHDNAEAVLRTVPVAGGKLLVVEAPTAELVHYSADLGLTLASSADATRATDLVAEALSTVVEPVPCLWSAVSELAWRCHIVLALNADYDVSFSHPAIPFSVFVSVPDRDVPNSVLRVAESLIHETMHLQLTLFESLCPLTNADAVWSTYSPWKQQQRPAQGVLHGLYVFSVLRWLWLRVSQESRCRKEREFALRRVLQIDEEISTARALAQSPALTEAGKHFLRNLNIR